MENALTGVVGEGVVPNSAIRQADKGLPSEVRLRMNAEVSRIASIYGADRSRKVLIVGGSGYIGGPDTSLLLLHGYQVRNIDNNLYGHAAAMTGFLGHPGYEFMYGDMGDPGVMERALIDVTDVIVLAGMVGDPITKRFPDEAHEFNDKAVTSCIEALNGQGLNKVIFVSTCSNYGLIGEDEVADEKFELKPLSLYAKSKVAAEQLILSKAGTVDYDATILRFATAFGLAPRMRFDLTVNEFTREMQIGNELVVFDSHTWRPYCHVKDFARLIDRVLRFPVEDVSFEVFNAGGDENNHTKQSIVDLIHNRLPAANVSYKENSSDPRNYRVDFTKVREALHFTPAYSVPDGVDEIIWAIRQHLLDDVEERRDFYGNYALPGLKTLHTQLPDSNFQAVGMDTQSLGVSKVTGSDGSTIDCTGALTEMLT